MVFAGVRGAGPWVTGRRQLVACRQGLHVSRRACRLGWADALGVRFELVLFLVEGRLVGAVGPDGDGVLLAFSGMLELVARLEQLMMPKEAQR